MGSHGSYPSTHDRLPSVDVVPNNEAIELLSGNEEHSAARAFRQSMRESDVFGRLRPTLQQEEIDDDAFALTQQRFAHRRRFGLRIGRIEQVELRALEMRGRQPVGNENYLPVRSRLRRQELPSQLQRMLNVGEVRREVLFLDVFAAHVSTQADDRVVDRDWLRQQAHELAEVSRLRDRVHLDELQEVAGVLLADEPIECERHPLHVDVLAFVAHRAAHIHQHGGRALRSVPRAMNDDVFRHEPDASVGFRSAKARLSYR